MGEISGKWYQHGGIKGIARMLCGVKSSKNYVCKEEIKTWVQR